MIIQDDVLDKLTEAMNCARPSILSARYGEEILHIIGAAIQSATELRKSARRGKRESPTILASGMEMGFWLGHEYHRLYGDIVDAQGEKHG